MKIVWVLLQTTRELTDSELGTSQLRLKKLFCLLTSESDCLRENFNNATQMSI